MEHARRGNFFKHVFPDGSVEHAKVLSGAILGRLVICVEHGLFINVDSVVYNFYNSQIHVPNHTLLSSKVGCGRECTVMNFKQFRTEMYLVCYIIPGLWIFNLLHFVAV